MTSATDAFARRGCLPAAAALLWLLSNPALAELPQPAPPIQPPTSPGLPDYLLNAAPVQSAPGAEWTYHKSADGSQPEPAEQHMLWMMNRARANPHAEGLWLANTGDSGVASAISFFGVNLPAMQAAFTALAAKPPAAFDIRLHDASELHSLALIARDSQDHNGQFSKVHASGFSCNGGRASVFSYTRSALHGHAALNIDWGYDTDGMQVPPGHREAIMGVWPHGGAGLTNVGLALVPESSPATQVGPLVFSGAYCQAGGADHNRFIVGTVWDDLDGDGDYDQGEGLSGVTVVPDSGTYYAVTGDAGGYAIPVTSAGSYQVSFSGGDLGSDTHQRNVAVGSESVLLDVIGNAVDTDEDGVPDGQDDFPEDPTETTDSDGDGVGDNADEFPLDPLEHTDSDGDGVGDNGDVFPDDPSEWADSDGDGIGDNSEEFPTGRFHDVPPGFWAYHFIEALADAGVTSGCAPNLFCPESFVSRAEMAIFIERVLHGAHYQPPAATGLLFSDVASGDFAAAFIEQLYQDGITTGCAAGQFCPGSSVSRAQMAIFLLRMIHGAGYSPPSALGLFTDVPANHWAVDWVEQLAAEGITQGCGVNLFCPAQAVTRGEMAVFLIRAMAP